MTDENFKKCFPFPTERPKQRKIIDTVEKCFNSGKKLVILCAPTAIGKSAIAMTLAKYYGDSYVLTSQKSLQDQYMNDFKNIGLKLIKGKGNYKCKLNENLTCDSGECVRKNKKCGGCTYASKRNDAYGSSLMVTNYAYFIGMHFSDYKEHIKRKFLVLDECIRKGQYIKTKTGDKLIENIVIGDEVLTFNINKKIYEYKPIEKIHINLYKSQSYDHFLRIELENGKILEVTPNHKIYTSNRGYIRADELTDDDDDIIFNSISEL